MSFATDEFKQDIRINYLQPSFRRDVDSYIKIRYENLKWGHRLDLLGKFVTGLAGLSATAALTWTEAEKIGTYGAVLLSTTSVVMHTIAGFMLKRSHANTEYLNNTLHIMGIDDVMPDPREEKSSSS